MCASPKVCTNSPGGQARDVGDEVGEQGVAGDVERDAQEQVGRALVELAGEPSVGDVELEERVAGRQRHLGDLGGVPGRDDQPPADRGASGSAMTALIPATTSAIWSIVRPSGASHDRHCLP